MYCAIWGHQNVDGHLQRRSKGWFKPASFACCDVRDPGKLFLSLKNEISGEASAGYGYHIIIKLLL